MAESVYPCDPVEDRVVDFYIKLIAKRGMISTVHAQFYLKRKILRDFLQNTESSLEDLTSFFQKFPGKFLVKGKYVYLPDFKKVSTPSVENKRLKKDYRAILTRLQRIAVDFYVNLISEHGAISTTQAHSFLANKAHLREYLKNITPLDDLGPFFKKYPCIFVVTEDSVDLAPCLKSNEPSKESRNSQGDNSSNHSEGFNERNCSPLSRATSLPSLDHIPGSTKTVKNSPSSTKTVKNIPSNTETAGNSICSRMKTVNDIPFSTDRVNDDFSRTTTCNYNPSSAETVSPSSDFDIKQLSKLLSLVVQYDSEPVNASASDNTEAGKLKKYQDAACQTMSSGPILSLTVFQEYETNS